MFYILDRFPIFNRIAGKRWFREYVASPIPDHVCNLQGGYRGGLTKGIILTTFDFEPPFKRNFFPKGWLLKEVSAGERLLVNLIESHTGNRLEITQSYIKPTNANGGASAWLLIDDGANKGVLYEAVFNYRLQDKRRA